MLFGDDFEPLADIVGAYQSRQLVPNKCLEVCGALLSATCHLYDCFVQCYPALSEPIPAAQTIAPLVAEVRRSLLRSLSLLSSLCLSTKRADWFPAILGANLATCAAIVFTDTMTAIPKPVQEAVWGNSHSKRMWMREAPYALLVDMLQASTKGVNPMKVQLPGSDEVAVNGNASEESSLMDGVDPSVFDGRRELKDWRTRHQTAMDQAKEMFRRNLYAQAAVQTIGSLYLLYDW